MGFPCCKITNCHLGCFHTGLTEFFPIKLCSGGYCFFIASQPHTSGPVGGFAAVFENRSSCHSMKVRHFSLSQIQLIEAGNKNNLPILCICIICFFKEFK